MTATVLVTGGAGYVGSHACKALAEAGYRPVVYDSLVHGHEWAVKWGPFESGDILDLDRLRQVFEKHEPVAVLHFAAFAHVGESVENPAKYFRNNVTGTLTVLEAMREAAVDKIVFSSTCATYGLPQQALMDENHEQRPINPYGASKLMVERCLQDYGRAYGLRSVILRYFNAAGADADNELGEDHDPETHLVPLVIAAALGRRPQVTVFGTDYDTPDGTCIRDYVHVSDLADAHVLALKALDNGAGCIAYNLGSSSGSSVKDVIVCVEQICGQSVVVQFGDRRPGDPDRLMALAGKAREELHWRPMRSGLEFIVRTAFDWHKDRRR